MDTEKQPQSQEAREETTPNTRLPRREFLKLVFGSAVVYHTGIPDVDSLGGETKAAESPEKNEHHTLTMKEVWYFLLSEGLIHEEARLIKEEYDNTGNLIQVVLEGRNPSVEVDCSWITYEGQKELHVYECEGFWGEQVAEYNPATDTWRRV